jgi:hypothetical protein
MLEKAHASIIFGFPFLLTAFLAGAGGANACGGWADVACNVGKAAEKAVHDTGNAAQTAGQQIGETVEKAAHDIGNTVEKGAHDTGHTLEKAGQDVGHFFKEAINFNLSCSLPNSKPEDIAVSYRNACGSTFSTYRHDIDVCNQAGGVSILAAGTASAFLSVTGAGAAT